MAPKEDFEGVVDLVKMKSIHWDEASKGTKILPKATLTKPCCRWQPSGREKLVEAAAEATEELMELYLEGTELSVQQILDGLRIRTIAGEIVPVTCGYGVQEQGCAGRARQAVIELMPSPVDVPPIVGELKTGQRANGKSPSDDEPFRSAGVQDS